MEGLAYLQHRSSNTPQRRDLPPLNHARTRARARPHKPTHSPTPFPEARRRPRRLDARPLATPGSRRNSAARAPADRRRGPLRRLDGPPGPAAVPAQPPLWRHPQGAPHRPHRPPRVQALALPRARAWRGRASPPCAGPVWMLSGDGRRCIGCRLRLPSTRFDPKLGYRVFSRHAPILPKQGKAACFQ